MTKSINLKLVLKITGFLLLIEGGFMLTSLIPSFYYKEGDFLSILYSSLLTIFTGLMLWLSFRKKEEETLGKREGYIVVSTAWIFFSLFGALPFLLSHSVDTYTDAFFETMSGVTTTGASVIKDIEVVPKGILYWRSLIQWLGGVGIIVLSLTILPLLGIGSMSLYLAEIPGPTKDKIHPLIKETAKRLWGIYLLLTVMQIILLMVGKMNFFDAINHSFTTMATGGYSIKNTSIAEYSPYIQYIITIFMFLAGVNFTMHYFALHGRFRKLWEDEELKFYISVILISSVIILLPLIYFHIAGVEKAFRDALFQVVSIVTTTGFVTADYLEWPGTTWLLIFLLFFTGACAGSTAGGIKMIRHIFLLKNSSLELKRLVHPNAIIPVRYKGKPVPKDVIFNVLAFFVFYMLIFAFGSFILSLTELDFETSIGSVASCLGNIGPGLGKTGPVGNYSSITDFGKWFLSFLMLLGRLELFTVLILFSPGFWKK
ncbi:MAG: TrkH family potassium uptake protein [Bacteroidales bacterium]|nr:TrkH family potassium uptake protein [Bacteroidales bacterium]